jgi:phosphatidylinositol alpha-1,6-mannosyltransferase
VDRTLRGQALRSADAILSLGPFTTSLLADWNVAPERVTNVPYGAQPRPAAPAPCDATLLSVARLVPRKGIDQVIRALPRLDPSVTYRVVGSGPDEARLRALARSEGVVERVAFLGRLSDADLAAEYQRCALFVLPARRTRDELEGYGLVYFEAAAWGRPVLAGRSGGEVDAVLDGQTGVLVNGESVDEIAAALSGLLADPERLRRLGEAGRKRVETTHNWSTAAAVVDSVLDQIA